MSLPRFSVGQTVLVNILFVVCMVAGCAALRATPVEFFQDVALNEVVIETVWVGASANEVERLVTAKLEDEIRSVAGIHEIRSVSQADFSQISIDFEETLDSADFESAVNDVRAALDRVSDLPDEAEEPRLREISTSETFAAVTIAVVDVGGVGELSTRDVAREAAARLRDLPGVSRVRIRAEREREVRVLVDRDRAARYGLTTLEVADRIRRQNLNLPAGTLETGASEASVRATGDYASLDEILATVLVEGPRGTEVRVRDVAVAERGLEKPRYHTRYNGRPAVMMSVVKKDDADVVELVERVDAWLEGYRRLVPPGIEVRKTLDSSAFVLPRIQVLIDNLWAGVVLVLGLLWFTIGFRNALLTIIAVPFSFLTAMILFPVLDISINSTTLIGMLLVSGMLVDDAIIVLENIYRRVESGQPLRAAVVEGSEEVLWPVVAAVSTTCAAFAPLLLVEGTAGKFVSILPKAVIVCLLASLFECLVILPAHYLEFGSRRRRQEGAATEAVTTPWGAGVRGGVERGLDRLRGAYLAALRRVVAHPIAFNALTLSLLLAAVAGAWRLPIDLFPGEYSSLFVSLESPPSYSLEATDAVTRGLEARLGELPGSQIEDFSTTVGSSVDLNYDQLSAPNLSITFVTLPQSEANTLAPERVLAAVRESLERHRSQQADGIAELRVEPQQAGPPVGKPVEVRIQGEDFPLAKRLAEELKSHLRTLPGVSNVDDNLKPGPPELRLRIDEERASQHGLTFQELATALRGANDGTIASSFRDPGSVEDEDIRVLLASGYRKRPRDLLDIELRSPGGYLVKLGEVAELEVDRGYLAYRRIDGKRAVTVSADVDDDLANSVSVNRDLQARFAELTDRHPEVEIVYGGEYQETNEALANTLAAFPVAFLLIYMILAALFRSYLQPLVVATSIPLGLAGIVFGVWLFGYNVSFILFYATIGLTGVVINDALVMVDFINRARASGMPIREAILQAGAQRLRPVLLTTLTTVLALLPMAIGLQGGSKTYGPFASAIAFGLLFAMLGTLFVVPLAYTSLLGLQARVRRYAGAISPWTSPRSGSGDSATRRVGTSRRSSSGPSV